MMGLAGAGAARVAAIGLMPFLLVLSILLIGRAHYLIHVRRHGHSWARRIVWIASVWSSSYGCRGCYKAVIKEMLRCCTSSC